MKQLEDYCIRLRSASQKLAQIQTHDKNIALTAVAQSINNNRRSILEANVRDIKKAKELDTKQTLIDRLSLDDKRIDAIINGINIIIAQKDPIGSVLKGWTLENGLKILQTRVPIGVAAIIYESRPNVTPDAFSIAYKSGNAILLRGSASALESNVAIVAAIKEGLKASGGIEDAIQLATTGDRAEVDWMLQARGFIDVLLPRGGGKFIRHVVDNAKVPVIETGAGNCHIFVDESADVEEAVKIIENAKMQRPSVCNAEETLLINKNCAKQLLPLLSKTLATHETQTGFIGGAELRCDKQTLTILQEQKAPQKLVAATDEDWSEEFLDYILAIKIVDSVDEAISHINKYSTHHSEAIVSKNIDSIEKFQNQIDAACVYINASTRFTDGEVFGFGAELGISTQKLHVRGPMGLEALTTTKYIITGNGQIRK